jgi:small conductance mechanosensitive channel
MDDRLQAAWGLMFHVFTRYGLDVIGAIVILIVGWWAAGWLRRLVSRSLIRTGRVDETLQSFLGSLTFYAVICFTVVAVLARFGVETTSFIAVLGAAGLAIGFALQGTLSNIAAGVMLLMFRPFKVGDYVEAAGLAGTIDRLSLFVTEMHTPDNVHVIVPNGQLWTSAVKNYSFHATRRVDLVVGIGYADEIDTAISSIREVISGNESAHRDPEPMVVVGELADSSVNLIIRVWCDNADYWPLKFELTKTIKEQLDGAGISIPYPQRDVHLIQQQA